MTTCYFHVTETLRKEIGSNLYIAALKKDMNLLHLCPTTQHFNSLHKLLLVKWTAENNTPITNALNKAYFFADWNGWHIGALPHAGAGLTNNSLESFNKTIKLLAKQSVTMRAFNHNTIPAILEYIADRRWSLVRGQSQIELLNNRVKMDIKLVTATRDVIKGKPANMLKVGGKWFVNTCDSRMNKKTMTVERINQHNEFNEASLPAATANDFKDKYMSMHVVEKVVRPGGQHTDYTCDCKQYMTYGTFCSHSLAAMHDDNAINFIQMTTVVEASSRKGADRRKGC